MNLFARKSIISLITLLPALLPAAARNIITEQPEGKVVEYYADFQNFDNTFGFMGDYHSVQKIVFSEDGSKVYFPNLLLRRTMEAYVEGICDADKKTITVEAGQWVFFFPNAEIPVALYSLDSEGKAGPTETTFYDEPLVFDIADDGTLTLRSSESLPMFGICNADNSEEVYQNAKDLCFTPVENVNCQLTDYSYSYIYESETTPTATVAATYDEDDNTKWIKGFVPKYPDAWVKIIKNDEGWFAPSFQVQMYFASDDPVVFAACNGDNLYTALPLAVDSATGYITAADGDYKMCTATSDGSSGYGILITYSDLSLEPTVFALDKPLAPTFNSYSVSNAVETEFIFSAEAEATNGNTLPKDKLAFRIFIDGAPYTFTPADYSWIKADMSRVPYTFDNYNFFSQGGNHGEKRYVYFQNLPADTETIAVETVYTLDGNDAVSDRLIYNIKTGIAETTGIEDVMTDDTYEAEYIDLYGRTVLNPEPGHIYIHRQGKSTGKVIF